MLIRTANYVKLVLEMVKSSGAAPVLTAQQALIEALGETSFVTMAVLTKIGADNDLSLTQLRVLGILRDRRPRMAVLADYLGLKKSSMTGLIDRAEKRGLVGRAPSAEDERAVEVFLTPKGAKFVKSLGTQLLAALSPLASGLSTSEQVRLETLLRRMLDAPSV